MVVYPLFVLFRIFIKLLQIVRLQRKNLRERDRIISTNYRIVEIYFSIDYEKEIKIW